ncbi:hypothetical protein NG895_06565 [Aeoliella sp. ICT_H6.2]|uniref:Uncharacterized protein n=1 Tax=Aeoliella straminimaris TaxID=2954799 RepID=A0A9X2F775_9BACT|nr:hypothetical protein [Aeoliella straminimaris]MCO6043565.1 hypothetical protein [Aeoliella straminimaris]
MARHRSDSDMSDNGVMDSFLDIVANIVGILILLVIVVGIRAAMQPHLDAQAPVAQQAPVLTEASVTARVESLTHEKLSLAKLHNQLVGMVNEADQRDADRIGLATHIAAVEEELKHKKSSLEGAEKERLKLRTAMAKADMQWQKLMLEKVAIESQGAKAKTLVHTPTPMVRSESDKRLYLRVEHGKVALVPLEALTQKWKGRSPDSLVRDLKRNNGIGELEPVGNYVLYYTHLPVEPPAGPRGVYALAGEIHPVVDGLGVTVDEALAQGSDLSRALEATTPQQTVVLVWAYPDSTAEVRKLQNALRRRGFAVDLRLLEVGHHIAFSPQGRGTAAQ